VNESNQRPQAAAGLGSKAAVELLADLAEARRAERVAVSLLAEVREELAATVILAKAKGMGYDRMGQVSLRAVRSPTVTNRRDLCRPGHRARTCRG